MTRIAPGISAAQAARWRILEGSIDPTKLSEQFFRGEWDPVKPKADPPAPPPPPREQVADKWQRLERGEWEGLGYASRSDADYAFIGFLARKYHNDPLLIDEAFRRSGMMREKWERESYRRITIQKIIQDAKRTGKILGVWLSQVTPRTIQWLWKPYVPDEMPTILSGDPGAGKTWIALWLAGEVTRASGRVLYLTIENPIEQVLWPRFKTLKGDLGKLKVVKGVEYGDPQDAQFRSVTLQDVDLLRQEIREVKPKLVVVDPIQSYLGANVDSHKANETRPVLDGLIQLAQDESFALLITRHCAKGMGGKAKYRGLGTIDITAAARCELLACEGPEGQMMMAHVKSNVSTLGATKTYKIEESVFEHQGETFEAGSFAWGNDSPMSAQDLVDQEASDSDENSAAREAEEFLRQAFSEGARFWNEVVKQAKGAGISERTLERTKSKLGIRSRPRPDKKWEAWLPEWSPIRMGAEVGEVGEVNAKSTKTNFAKGEEVGEVPYEKNCNFRNFRSGCGSSNGSETPDLEPSSPTSASSPSDSVYPVIIPAYVDESPWTKGLGSLRREREPGEDGDG